jgi:hypothetical protein
MNENFEFFGNPKSFSVLSSSDFFLKTLFDEFLVRYSFLKENLLNFSSFSFFYFRNFFVKRSQIYLINAFSLRNIIKNSCFLCLHKSISFTKFVFKLLIPFAFILEKLRTIGFLHSSKIRPIALVKYVFSEDILIIRFFSSISYFMLTWFQKLDNFSSLEIILNLIKASCFLTLSRKHKKSLSWSYSLYTKEILYTKSVSMTSLSFPLLNNFPPPGNPGFFYYIPFALNEFFFMSL